MELFSMSPQWRQVDTTCEPCTACHSIIYGNQYQLFLGKNPCDQILCEACYIEVNKEPEGE